GLPGQPAGHARAVQRSPGRGRAGCAGLRPGPPGLISRRLPGAIPVSAASACLPPVARMPPGSHGNRGGRLARPRGLLLGLVLAALAWPAAAAQDFDLAAYRQLAASDRTRGIREGDRKSTRL